MFEWRYLPRGRVAHAVRPGDSGASCGVTAPAADEWRGTGTQDEYERVAALPACPRCTAQAGPRPAP